MPHLDPVPGVLDFEGPPVPFRGATPSTTHASYTGAVHATQARSANIVMLRQLWREPRTINEMAVLTHLPISSVCSLKKAIENDLEFVDYEPIEWGEGRKSTKRSRWRMRSHVNG